MRWSGATGAIARCKSRSTVCARKYRSVPAWHWICGVKPKPKAGNKPSPHSIMHGLDKPGVFTTVSFDPSSFPKRGTHSVGVKRQWCGHRGKVDNCQVGVFMGYVSDDEHALLDFRLSLPQEWARDEQRRQE